MRATPGLVVGAGLAAGLMSLLGRQRGKRRRRPTLLGEHRWTVLGVVASALTAGMVGLWRREPRHTPMATTIEAPIEHGRPVC